MIKIGIHGASGKMGKTIAQCLEDSDEAVLSTLYDTNFKGDAPSRVLIAKSLEELFGACDVVIDFTAKEGAINLINYARTDPKPLVIGTTGLGEEGAQLLKLASSTMPILYATNMSLGVAVLKRLVAVASKTLEKFDIEIVEQHHRHKKDAPSGTALTLGERDLKVPGVFVFVGLNVNNDVLRQENGEFLCDMEAGGQVSVDLKMQTSVPGLFAAGDIRKDAPKQVIVAAGDGAVAALSALSYIESLH